MTFRKKPGGPLYLLGPDTGAGTAGSGVVGTGWGYLGYMVGGVMG